jgi:hypothetical protein
LFFFSLSLSLCLSLHVQNVINSPSLSLRAYKWPFSCVTSRRESSIYRWSKQSLRPKNISAPTSTVCYCYAVACPTLSADEPGLRAKMPQSPGPRDVKGSGLVTLLLGDVHNLNTEQYGRGHGRVTCRIDCSGQVSKCALRKLFKWLFCLRFRNSLPPSRRHLLVSFSPGQRVPATLCLGGWVGPRAGLHAVEKKRLSHCRDSNTRRPSCSPSIYRLSYPEFPDDLSTLLSWYACHWFRATCGHAECIFCHGIHCSVFQHGAN